VRETQVRQCALTQESPCNQTPRVKYCRECSNLIPRLSSESGNETMLVLVMPVGTMLIRDLLLCNTPHTSACAAEVVYTAPATSAKSPESYHNCRVEEGT